MTEYLTLEKTIWEQIFLARDYFLMFKISKICKWFYLVQVDQKQQYILLFEVLLHQFSLIDLSWSAHKLDTELGNDGEYYFEVKWFYITSS